MSDELETLRNLLEAHGLPHTPEEISDNALESLILEAKLLVNEPYMFDNVTEDYEPDFDGETYMTEDYPIHPESVSLSIDDAAIAPERITKEGIIYLDNIYHGKLSCTYTVGLDGADVENYLLPIVVYMVKDKEGKNVSSIQEGDINISYDTTSNAQISMLIERLTNKYNGRVVFI